ncbi:peroxiredoxin family protein [Corallincola spongiicola]|uniref:Peroxiredoxin family protein n=1 Tax=Corallincola spongiicola TaxID=2520508 RepID=A0ABY1WP11_9GAMM|nr:peroxiredoxin family protein [Corallincola spongiicola]TAA45834.1 peroxiredoxin family protein [Corallincola spongiicola]
MSFINAFLTSTLLSLTFISPGLAADTGVGAPLNVAPVVGSEEGNIAPDFTLTDADGRAFRLSDYKGKKAVYLVFWNTWCGHCIHKVPTLIKRQQQFAQQLEIFAINTGWDDSIALMAEFQAEYGINYPLAFDHGAQVTDQYGVWGTPTEFIVDINGVIQHRDGVPKQLVSHLAAWNQLSEPSDTQLAGQCEGDAAC